MPPAAHPGHLLKRELTSRSLSAKSARARHRRAIRPDHGHLEWSAFHHRGYRWSSWPVLWQQRPILAGLAKQYDIAMIERERSAEITRRVRPADAA
jgi:antitoxin HigA-1